MPFDKPNSEVHTAMVDAIANRFTVAELARRVGVNPLTVNTWLKEQRQPKQIQHRIRLYTILGLEKPADNLMAPELPERRARKGRL